MSKGDKPRPLSISRKEFDKRMDKWLKPKTINDAVDKAVKETNNQQEQ